MDNHWPKRENGTRKTIGEMTPAEKREAFSRAAQRLQAEMQDPQSGLHRAILSIQDVKGA